MTTRDKNLQNIVQSVAIDLRVVLNDARRKLDEFEKYVDSWDQAVAEGKAEGPESAKLRMLTEQYVAARALEMVDEIVHMPTGGSQHMHVRTARQRLLTLLAAGN